MSEREKLEKSAPIDQSDHTLSQAKIDLSRLSGDGPLRTDRWKDLIRNSKDKK
jgi:hypothetical protein